MATTPSSAARQDRAKNVKKKSGISAQCKLPRLKRPDGLSLEEWQRALRRQFGVEQRFQVENIGEEPVFSEFRVPIRRARIATVWRYAAASWAPTFVHVRTLPSIRSGLASTSSSRWQCLHDTGAARPR